MIPVYVPDNYDQYRRHEAEQESALDLLPACCDCGEKITGDRCWMFGDEPICDRCAEQNYRKYTTDLMG